VKPWTVRRILEWTDQDLSKRGVDSARLDAEVLLAHVLGVDRLGLYLDLDRPLDEVEREAYREMVARRREREPVVYLTGTKEFWSIELEVPPGVLIPRPDTEILVEEALEVLPREGRPPVVVDVGCGSGCIGLALATERQSLRLLAMDIDRLATEVTLRNSRSLGLEARVRVLRTDLLAGVGSAVDLVASNLPYIPTREIDALQPEIARYEPRRALDGGEDGLDLFRRLIAQATLAVVPGGHLLLEVGDDAQADQVTALLGERWELIKVRRDYSGVQRTIVARRSPI
jgi:release factor glutamine methyltransferase